MKKSKIALLGFIATSFVLGAGIATLPSNSASANETQDFYMDKGAAVSLVDDYGGIRWRTTIGSEWYQSQASTAEKMEFGTFVVPTLLYESALATDATVEIKDIPDVINIRAGALDASANDVTYYSAVKYDDIIADYEEANGVLDETGKQALLEKAYEMELTAISYVCLDEDTYIYADFSDTSRSARQVAIVAQMAGDVNGKPDTVKTRIKGYYGGNDIAVYSDSKNIVDMSIATTAQTVSVGEITGTVEEVLIGAKRVEGNVENNVVTLTDISDVKEGETSVSVITSDGVFSSSCIAATKVIKTAQELANLQSYTTVTQGTVSNGSTNYTYYSYGGYFVLGNNLTATDADATFGANNVGGSAGTFVSANGGFHGTFDGQGYTISGFKYQIGGVFGDLGDGAVIKNVAFADCDLAWSTDDTVNSFTGVVACNAVGDWAVENVFVDGTTKGRNAGMLFGRFVSNGTIKDTIIKMNVVGGHTLGAICSWPSQNATPAYDNVSVIYNATASGKTQTQQMKCYGNQSTFVTGVAQYTENASGELYKITATTPSASGNTLDAVATETTATTANAFSGYDADCWIIKTGSVLPTFKSIN